MNTVILSGYIGQDPQIKITKNKAYVINFSLATKRTVKINDKYEYLTDWHYITAFGEYNSKIIKKGYFAIIKGNLRETKYNKDGKDIRYYGVFADNIEIVETVKKGKSGFDDGSPF
ncbi:single-stranded DNA-binding protein [Candidatus Phytoplasma meliae]|uniref:Single-stranded DNA-binding protein n=1 Tax=Candidatus Phytoplasma meliae TaxID=1848402 RepID=A0ABS5CYJ8_9MOLU|nr:single-stranded DNA-binding protein [Candidatus Phytoplasma meliae]MBP5836053.1 single-stranded DNA-binding protein [Candidatus Phytoplasma meliae]